MNFLRFLSSGNSFLGFSFSNPTIPLENHNIPQVQQTVKVESNPHTLMESQISSQIPSQLLSNPLEYNLIEQQRQLINHCLKMNLQLMEKVSKDQSNEQVPLIRKRIKKVNRCQHIDKKHYAKGLCNNCYHRYGRSKKPWNCKHEVLYAAGMCQNCYINKYNKMRRDQKNQEEELDIQTPIQNALEEDQSN